MVTLINTDEDIDLGFILKESPVEIIIAAKPKEDTIPFNLDIPEIERNDD